MLSIRWEDIEQNIFSSFGKVGTKLLGCMQNIILSASVVCLKCQRKFLIFTSF